MRRGNAPGTEGTKGVVRFSRVGKLWHPASVSSPDRSELTEELERIRHELGSLAERRRLWPLSETEQEQWRQLAQRERELLDELRHL